jgi:hypothetical protein
MLHAHAKGLVSLNVVQPIQDRAALSGFESEHWLLGYEAWHKGWSRPIGNVLAASAFAQDLHAAGVSFYRTTFRKYESARHVLGAPRWLLDFVPYG